MILGVPQLGFRARQRRLRRDPLRLEARDLGIGSDRIGLPAHDVLGGGIELRVRPADRGVRGRHGVPQALDLLAR